MRDQDEIRFRVKRVEKASDKVCLIIQVRRNWFDESWHIWILERLSLVVWTWTTRSTRMETTSLRLRRSVSFGIFYESAEVRFLGEVLSGIADQLWSNGRSCDFEEIWCPTQAWCRIVSTLLSFFFIIPFNGIDGTYRLRCLNAKAWEDRPTVLRQIEQIGEKSCVQFPGIVITQI